MIDNARQNEIKNISSRYGNQLPGYGMQAGYGYNDYYSNPDDEPLENYLAVQDADAVTLDKSYGMPTDFYYTETIPYDGRLSPDQLGFDRNDENLEFVEEDVDENMLAYEEARREARRENNNNYNDRSSARRPSAGPRGPSRRNEREDYDDERDAYNDRRNQYPARPKTANRYGVDSSYYLDDPNYDM